MATMIHPSPSVLVIGLDGQTVGQVTSPEVLRSTIRPDLVKTVHENLLRNRLRPHAVSSVAGHKTAAGSWGTGRAVARIPRVPGGGTRRTGQGAFGNMCRGGHMYAATKIYRKWRRKVNNNLKRLATVSALAASALPPLVVARGHRIEGVPEIPMVLDDAVECVSGTSKALTILMAVGAGADVDRSSASRHIRRGRGKMRNRRYKGCKGPMIVYANDFGLSRAFRNIPGVDVAKVESLNLLKIAPGGQLGRFIIWTKSAIETVGRIFGSLETPSNVKKGYVLPRNCISNSNLNRLINSDEVQTVVNEPKNDHKMKRAKHKKNPLRNKSAAIRLNPYIAKKIKHKKGKKTRDNKTARTFYKQLSADNEYQDEAFEGFHAWLGLKTN